jgi:NAD(P)-dependent dehydrogenase (short-subunit alcohol dehydrogenase family)
MRAQKGGLIVNVSSWAGLYASKLTGPAYNTTKRALLALTESINMEECQHGIRATSLLPGEVATPILDKRPTPPSPEQRDRMVQTQDMGQALLFLAQMPARTCINELVISPTLNRFYLGGLEAPPAR